MKKLILTSLVLLYSANTFCLPNYMKAALIALVGYFAGSQMHSNQALLELNQCNSMKDMQLNHWQEMYSYLEQRRLRNVEDAVSQSKTSAACCLKIIDEEFSRDNAKAEELKHNYTDCQKQNYNYTLSKVSAKAMNA